MGDRRISTRLGVTAVELLPVHHFVDDPFLVEQRAVELLGLQLDRLLRAARGLLERAAMQGEQVAEFKQMVKNLHAAGHRGDPRRGLQSHGGGQSPRADALLPRRSTTPPTTGSTPKDPRYYMDYTGCGNTLNMHASARAPAHHGFAALLGDRDARGWLPLRPRLGARRANCTTWTSWVGLLRHHPPGSGALAGEADRRAVGRRRGRLSGGQLPGDLGGVEWQVSRLRARLLEGRRAG